MTEKQSFFKRFFEDLKRRHVVRVAVGYIIVSWVILQVADVLLPALDLGDWVFRALLTTAFIGFFVVVILSWVFDISDHHLVKTKGGALPRWVKSVISLPLIAAVGFGGWWVWSGYVTEKESALHPTELTSLPIVAVMPFRNMTGDQANDWFSEGLANLVRDNLTRSKYLRIVSPQKFSSIIGDVTDMAVISKLSEEEGIAYILGGEMLITPTGISVTSRLSDTTGGVDLYARQTENLTKESLLSAAAPIASQVKQGLKVPRTEQIDIFAADFATQNLSAYESYIAGLGFFVDYQYEQAEQAFNAALQLAPDFAVARYRLAYIQATTGRVELASENVTKALTVANIPDREKRYIEAAQALFAFDYDTAIGLYQALLTEYPFEIEARELLAKSYWGQYKAEEAVAELQILAAEEPQNEVIWATLGGYLLAMGEFDRAQPALERFATLAPDNANSYTLLGDSLRYQGNFEAAVKQYNKALEIDPTMREVAASLATIDYLRGEYQKAENGFANIVEDESRIVRERLDAMFALQAMLAARGNYSAAEELIERFSAELKEEQYREAMATSIQALLKLELGNEAAARELAAAAIGLSPGVPTRYLFAHGLVQLHLKEYDLVSATATELLSHALPADDPDRTEEKASAYLTGLVSLEQGDWGKAGLDLARANELGGYAYRVYELALARVLAHEGKTDEALEVVRKAIIPEMVDPRIDFEPERVQAMLVMAEIARSAGDLSLAGSRAKQFLLRFDQAGPGHANVILARDIITEAELAYLLTKKKGDMIVALGK